MKRAGLISNVVISEKKCRKADQDCLKRQDQVERSEIARIAKSEEAQEALKRVEQRSLVMIFERVHRRMGLTRFERGRIVKDTSDRVESCNKPLITVREKAQEALRKEGRILNAFIFTRKCRKADDLR